MRGIGGNTIGTFQVSSTGKNAIGEQVQTWTDVQTLKGWLDLASGDAKYTVFDAKVQQSTHVFVADYVPLDARIQAETTRFVVDGKRYDIMLLDNPMELKSGSQWEIYLKYTGGQ